MSTIGQQWKGGSGKKYEFTVYSVDTIFDRGQNGNYIFAKLVNNIWQAVYIGEGDLRERTETHKYNGCVLQKGATHIHARINSDEQSRKDEETDLLVEYLEAYEPSGCNVKIGG